MTKDDYYNEKLIEFREKKKLTQEAVAQSIGVTRFTIIRAEKGEAASWKLLQSLSTFYETSMSEILRVSQTSQIAA